MDLFSYSVLDNELNLNDTHVLLIKEFAALFNRDKKRAFKEFTYIYLMIDWKSPYAEYTDVERKAEAKADSGLTDEELNDPLMLAACEKYYKMQDNNLSLKAVKAARRLVHNTIDYFENVVDYSRMNDAGMPIFKPKDIMNEVNSLDKYLDGLDKLKERIMKQLSRASSIRGDQEEGFMPKDFD